MHSAAEHNVVDVVVLADQADFTHDPEDYGSKLLLRQVADTFHLGVIDSLLGPEEVEVIVGDSLLKRSPMSLDNLLIEVSDKLIPSADRQPKQMTLILVIASAEELHLLLAHLPYATYNLIQQTLGAARHPGLEQVLLEDDITYLVPIMREKIGIGYNERFMEIQSPQGKRHHIWFFKCHLKFPLHYSTIWDEPKAIPLSEQHFFLSALTGRANPLRLYAYYSVEWQEVNKKQYVALYSTGWVTT